MKRSPPRSPAPVQQKSTASASPSPRSTRRCIRSVSASRGRWTPGRSTSTSSQSGAGRDAADLPAGGLRLVRDDRHLAAHDRVHERRLARVGAARQRDEARACQSSSITGPGAKASPPRRSRGRSRTGAARRGPPPREVAVCSGQIRTSPSSRGPPAGPVVHRKREHVGRAVATVVLAVQIADPLRSRRASPISCDRPPRSIMASKSRSRCAQQSWGHTG